jgi:tetratricopeptide (TPR) repeat protein
MSEWVKCPDCGRLNPAGSAACAQCNFPLNRADGAIPAGAESRASAETGTPAAGAPRTTRPAAEGESTSAAPPGETVTRPLRPLRPRPPRPAPQALSIWLLVAAVAAVAVLIVAVNGFHQSNFAPIEGAKVDQQKKADEVRAALAKDSTDVEAHIALANVLFDTGNWSEAIIHYRAALARDSTHATTLVDLGVCYYNLGAFDEAEKLFLLSLKRDPHQPVALFNLGIVNERRGDNKAALQFLHQAIESDPPEGMRQPLIEAMQRVQKALGITAPPLPEGAAK